LVRALVSLKCKRHKKYESDPKLYEHASKTVEEYKDRADFVAVDANKEDKFEEVATATVRLRR
jgi:hypothetical protein